MKIILFTTITFFIINAEICQAQHSRIDLGCTFMSTSFTRSLYHYPNPKKDTSGSQLKTGIIFTYRYKINIFSSLELGFCSGYHQAEYHYSGFLVGVDLKQNFEEYFSIELSAKYFLAGGNRGSTHNPSTHNDYTLFSLGIGKDIWQGLGLIFNIYTSAPSFIGEYNFQHGVDTGTEKLNLVTSIKLYYNY